MKSIRLAMSTALAVSFCAAGQTPTDFAYRLPLATAGDAAFFRVGVPAPVYEGAVRADLSDLRIFNRDGAPVAFAFVPRPVPDREAAVAVALPLFPLRIEEQRRDLSDLALSVRRGASGTTVDLTTRDGQAVAAQRLVGYFVDASDLQAPLATLVLPLPAGSNLATRVRVDGSDDLVAWRSLATNAPLLELEHAGRRLTRDRVELAGGAAKYLRILFESGQPAPDLATVRGEFADRAVDAPREWRTVAGAPDKESAGDYVFDVGGVFPVDRVTLVLPEINTVAPVQLFTRATPKDEWRPAGATVFYRLKQDGGDAINPSFAVGVGSPRYWKVRVDPKSGGVGNEAPRLSVGWHPQALVFAARGNAPFELAYGSVTARAAALPIETLVPGYDREDKRRPVRFAEAIPGAPNIAPAAKALREPLDLKRWLLWASLALATIVLGWMAIRLSRDMGSRPPAPADAASRPDSGASGP